MDLRARLALVQRLLNGRASPAELREVSAIVIEQARASAGSRNGALHDDVDQHQREIERLRSETEHLRKAMETRATIEQAKGIVMASMRCSPEEAFEILNQQSQSTNRKLRDIAEDVVRQQSKAQRVSSQRR